MNAKKKKNIELYPIVSEFFTYRKHSRFIQELLDKSSFCQLSERQIDVATNIIKEIQGQSIDKILPDKRTSVTATITRYYRTTYPKTKTLVLKFILEDSAGNKYYCKVPHNLSDHKVGDEITVRATRTHASGKTYNLNRPIY